MAFKLQDCIVANFFIKFKAAPYHCLRNVPQMGQAEGKEGQMLFTINVKATLLCQHGNSRLQFDDRQQFYLTGKKIQEAEYLSKWVWCCLI